MNEFRIFAMLRNEVGRGLNIKNESCAKGEERRFLITAIAQNNTSLMKVYIGANALGEFLKRINDELNWFDPNDSGAGERISSLVKENEALQISLQKFLDAEKETVQIREELIKQATTLELVPELRNHIQAQGVTIHELQVDKESLKQRVCELAEYKDLADKGRRAAEAENRRFKILIDALGNYIIS
jgi:hypothetical protein